MFRFDAHTHAFPPEIAAGRDSVCARDAAFAELYADPKAKLSGVEELARALERAGMDGAAVAGFAFAHERDIAAQNEYLLAMQAPGLALGPLVTVNPRLPGWEAALARAAERGARGVGELRPGNQGWHPLGPEGLRLGELARDLGLVLLWHVSEPLGHAYPGKLGGIGPVELVRFALRFPDVTMIAAHLGGGASFHLQMPEIANTLNRLYFDTAAAFLLYDEQSIHRLADVVGANRVLFGSDFPLLSPRRQVERAISSLPPEVVPLVSGENARQVFLMCESK